MLKITTGETIHLESESIASSLSPQAAPLYQCLEQPPSAKACHQPFDFDRWYNEYSGLVRGLIARYIKDADVRDDLHQIAWSRLARVGERYDPTRSKETTFIGLITRRVVLDYLEREQRRARLLPGIGSSSQIEVDFTEMYGQSKDSTPIESAIAHEQRTALSEHLAALDPRQRAILFARFYHGLSYQLLAEEFDIPLGTAKSLINRTLARIRRAMKEPDTAHNSHPSPSPSSTSRDRF